MAKRKATEKAEQKDVKKPTKAPHPRTSISICIPSTVISNKNAHNLEQKTMICYQIAKACLIYNVAEIVVLKVPEKRMGAKGDEEQKTPSAVTVGNKVVFNEDFNPVLDGVEQKKNKGNDKANGSFDKSKEDALLLASLLQFFITPPYLIKTVFLPHLNPHMQDILHKFKYAYKLPKITTLPFMQNNEVYRDFKEGIIIPRETPKIKAKLKSKKFRVKAPHKVTVSKYVNIGEREALELDISREIPIYLRVTVDLKNKTIVSPQRAYGVVGHESSFGYLVRVVDDGFHKVFTKSPVVDGYNCTVFVLCDDYFNKLGKVLDEVKEYEDDEESRQQQQAQVQEEEKEEEEKDSSKKILVVVGNYKDFQLSFEDDEEAKSTMFEGLDGVLKLFDYKLNIPLGCRTEDGVLIALTKLLE